MTERLIRIGVVALLALVFVPVLIAQVLPSESRRFTGVSLDEVSYDEVAFRNEEQDIDLGGMLLVPPGDGPFPAAVIIHGSGPSQRANGWYLTLAQGLQERGIVVLLPDKRGSERSSGDWRIASLEDLATDTVAAVSYLTARSDVPIASIGVIGMSQGGRIAPITAGHTEEIGWVVNVVGGATPAFEALRYEEVHNLREMGFLPGISDAIAHLTTFLLINASDAEFWRTVGDFDPLPYWEALEVPGLVLLGEDDTNVPTAASAERLRGLDDPDISVSVYSGSGHALADPPRVGDEVFRSDALDEIVDFISASV